MQMQMQSLKNFWNFEKLCEYSEELSGSKPNANLSKLYATSDTLAGALSARITVHPSFNEKKSKH